MIPIVKLEQIIKLKQRVVLCCLKVGLLSTTNTEKIKKSGERGSPMVDVRMDVGGTLLCALL